MSFKVLIPAKYQMVTEPFLLGISLSFVSVFKLSHISNQFKCLCKCLLNLTYWQSIYIEKSLCLSSKIRSTCLLNAPALIRSNFYLPGFLNDSFQSIVFLLKSSIIPFGQKVTRTDSPGPSQCILYVF